MSAWLELSRDQVLIFLFVLTRLSGVLCLTPAAAMGQAGWPWRLLLAAALALLISPLFWGQPVPSEAAGLVSAFCREAVLGLVLGVAVLIVGGGLQAAGQLIGQLGGMSLVEPAGETSPVPLARLYDLLALAAFLLIGGHRLVLGALLDTFHWMPPSQAGFSTGLWATLSELTSQSFSLALRSSAPVVVALMLSALVVGFLQRAVPQLHALAAGLPVQALVAMTLIAVSAGGAVWLFQHEVETAVAAMIGDLQSADLASGSFAGGSEVGQAAEPIP
jgi:flagellar biosynthetic protein FliR